MKKLGTMLRTLLLAAAAVSLLSLVAFAAGDPTGASYTAVTGSETLGEVASVANKAYFGANYTWVMSSRARQISRRVPSPWSMGLRSK